MKYNVLTSFTDNKDGNRVYRAGKDTYPHEGYTPDEKRIAYLSGSENRFKRPLIAAIPEPAAVAKEKK